MRSGGRRDCSVACLLACLLRVRFPDIQPTGLHRRRQWSLCGACVVASIASNDSIDFYRNEMWE